VTPDLAGCARDVELIFHHILDDLETMRRSLVECFDAGPVDSGVVRALVEPFAASLLADPDVVGAGFVAARDALGDQELYLAWWQGDDQHLLTGSGAPATGAPLDYTRHPWFRVPEQTGHHHVTGPYVDFVCTDEYVMTSTAPVVSGGRMVGVVGADTLVETLETRLLPSLRAAGASVVNDLGRTVASADPRLAPGSLLGHDPTRASVACRRLPLSVVTTG
jgi:hypothetical protein